MRLGFIAVLILMSCKSHTLMSQSVDQARYLNTLLQRMTPLGDNIDGSPNFSETWEKGIVHTSEGAVFDITSMMYNVYIKNIVFLKEGHASVLPQTYSISKFSIGDSFFIAAPFKGGNTTDFFQVLSNGSVKLLKRFQCKLIEAQPAQGIVPATNAKFDMESEYYTKVDDEPAEKMKPKKKQILRVMKNKFQEIEKYINSRRLNLKDERDLIKVFGYYNNGI